MAGRAFSSDPAQAARATKAAVEGWRAGGVAATAKHFPGLGGATTNTDFGSATIGGGAPTDADLAPFKAAIAAKVPLIMSATRALPAARRQPHRLAVAGDPQGPAARAARLRGRRDHGLDRGQGRARHRRRPSRSPCARSGRATTSCSPPARARGSGPTGRCSPRRGHRRAFRALVRTSAASRSRAPAGPEVGHPSTPKWRLKQDRRAKSSAHKLTRDEGRAAAPAAARQ